MIWWFAVSVEWFFLGCYSQFSCVLCVLSGLTVSRGTLPGIYVVWWF